MNEVEAAMVLDRLKSIDENVSDFRRSSEKSRARLHEKVEETNRQVLHLDHRLSSVEAALLTISPAVEEFKEYKAKVAGAGQLGSWLWRFGGWVLSAAAAAFAAWSWFSAHFHWK